MKVHVIMVWHDDQAIRFDVDIEFIAGLIPLLKTAIEKHLIKYFNISM